MYSPLCLLQAITFLEPLHGCADTNSPDVCRQLADCHLKNGAPAAAVTVYESIVDSESARGMKVATHRSTALLLPPAIDGRPRCPTKGFEAHVCLQLACRSLPVTNSASCMAVALADAMPCHWRLCMASLSGDMQPEAVMRLTLTAAPLQCYIPTRVSFRLCQGPHTASSDAVQLCRNSSLPWRTSELLPCSAPCCPAGPELSAEDRTDLVLAMVEALIEQGQPHQAEVALQRLQGPGADHSRADSPEVLLRRSDMVLKLGHEVRSQHSSRSRPKPV